MLTVDEISRAELEIIKHVQAHSFEKEVGYLRKNGILRPPSGRKIHSTRQKSLRGKSDLCRLDPFLDDSSFLRVGDAFKMQRFQKKSNIQLFFQNILTSLSS